MSRVRRSKTTTRVRRSKKPGPQVNLFLDSGAFSAWSKGHEIDIDDYADFIEEYEKYLTVYANLDVIGDPEATYENQKYLEDERGLKPLPCFHLNTDIKFLKRYLDEGYEYLALGGMVGTPSKKLMPWLDDLYNNHLTDKKGYPLLKIHGFGVTSLKLLLRYPWHCMTEEHQVLTKNGWKNREELSVGEMVLTFNDGVSDWEPILEVPTFDVTDVEISKFSHRTFAAEVTANHRWRVVDRNGKWLWKTTEELKANHHIPRIGDYKAPTEKTYSDELVEMMGWFWTDGSIKKRPKYKSDSVVIYQSNKANPAKVARIRKVLVSANEKFCEYSAREGTENTFELYGSIRDQLLDISPDKKLTLPFILSLTKKQLRLFVEVSVLADGTKKELIREPNSFILGQKHGNCLEEFRIACLLAGHTTSRWNRSKTGIESIASSSVKLIYPHSVRREGNEKKELYSGKIWCIRVTSGAFFTKCKDTIYVTGNSVDSTSWVKTGRFGTVLVPQRENGKYIYHKLPYKVTISDRSPTKEVEGKHFDTYNEHARKQILHYFEEKGYCHKELSEDYQKRDELNIMYFLDLEAFLPDRPFNKKNVKGTLF